MALGTVHSSSDGRFVGKSALLAFILVSVLISVYGHILRYLHRRPTLSRYHSDRPFIHTITDHQHDQQIRQSTRAKGSSAPVSSRRRAGKSQFTTHTTKRRGAPASAARPPGPPNTTSPWPWALSEVVSMVVPLVSRLYSRYFLISVLISVYVSMSYFFVSFVLYVQFLIATAINVFAINFVRTDVL